MTFDLQSWVRTVWLSLTEPATAATHAIEMRTDQRTLWTAMALIAVLNVLFLAFMQAISPVPVAFQQNTISLSPFGLTAMLGFLMALLVFTTYYAGQMLDGKGDLHATLIVMVLFHAVSLSLELIQIVLVFVSPYLSAIFGLITIGGLVWCILNFIDVLHGFKSLGKSFFALAVSLIGMALIGGVLLAILGVAAPGGSV